MSIRKRISALVLAGSLVSASAQIPNGGFEDWQDQGGYLDPVGWLTYNDVITPGPWPAVTVEQGGPGPVGDFHAVITTVAVPLSSPIQGWISAGVSGSNAGFPYTARPAVLTGQWQYGIQASDIGQVQVALSKWNSISSSTELIAQGSLEVTGDLTVWQAFSLPLTYLSSDTPDTAYIQIVSSISFASPVVGSFIKVDDLAFAGTVGMAEQDGQPYLSVFPSPAIDRLTISSSEAGELHLFDATGRMVCQIRINGNDVSLDVSSFAPGFFTYHVVDLHGQPLASGRWVKE